MERSDTHLVESSGTGFAPKVFAEKLKQTGAHVPTGRHRCAPPILRLHLEIKALTSVAANQTVAIPNDYAACEPMRGPNNLPSRYAGEVWYYIGDHHFDNARDDEGNALAIAAFLVPTTLIFHNPLGPEGAAQMTQFLKNLSILGGMLVVAAFGPGAWSVDRRRESP